MTTGGEADLGDEELGERLREDGEEDRRFGRGAGDVDEEEFFLPELRSLEDGSKGAAFSADGGATAWRLADGISSPPSGPSIDFRLPVGSTAA